MRIIIFILAMLCTLQSIAQSKQDYTWLWGRQSIPNSTDKRGVKFTFTSNGIKAENHRMKGEVFRQVGLMSDKETGELLFYTNGCSVYNREEKEMPNGNGINDVTPQFDWFCPGGYAAPNNNMVLPDPGNENGYYIIHKPVSLIEEEQNRNETLSINFSYVDMDLDDGLGDITLKNEVIYDEKVTNYGFLNACQHANGEDWWILQPLEDSNVFLSILLTENGFEIRNEQSIGVVHLNDHGTLAQVSYSRDGGLFMINNSENNLMLYDFDRETGLLSNYRNVYLRDYVGLGYNGGLAISPNNRFVYASILDELYQIDLWSTDLQESVLLIDTFVNRADGYDSYFNHILTGPDCKLYITASAGTQFMHVIHNPDELGADCDFQQDGIEAPQFMPGTFSYIYPHWRMDEDKPCDDTMVGLYDVYGVGRNPYTIFPNPVADVAILDVEPEAEIVRYELLTVSGQMIQTAAVSDIETPIDMTELSSGMYFLKVYDVDGAWKVEKIVKE